MRLEMKDLQDAHDQRFSFPMYLLRLTLKKPKKFTSRMWSTGYSESDLSRTTIDLQVLAFAELAGSQQAQRSHEVGGSA